jgi:hypothetical protein
MLVGTVPLVFTFKLVGTVPIVLHVSWLELFPLFYL